MLLLVSLLAACTSDPRTGPAPTASEQVAVVVDTSTGPTTTVGVETGAESDIAAEAERLAAIMAASDASAALEAWGYDPVPAATEVEWFSTLEEMTTRASLVVVGRIIGPGPQRQLHGDPGTGDSLVYGSYMVEVIAALGGTRDATPGDMLRVEGSGPQSEKAVDTVAILFLRLKSDDHQGRADPNALNAERGLYRLVSSQGVFIDRGDGVPVNPFKEAQLASMLGEGTPTEVALGPNLHRHGMAPVAATVREMTVTELIVAIFEVAAS